VWLADMSHVVVQDLELTDAGNSTTQHRGLYFTASTGTVSDLTIRNLVVHDVDGSTAFNDTDKSGGGIAGQALSARGRFSNVLIEYNRIYDVAREGIVVFGSAQTSTRPPATSPWPQGTSGLVIRDNSVDRPAGDGIVALGSTGALIEYNLVRDGNLTGFNFFGPARDCSAGIWTFDSNRTLIQYNEVSGMHYGPSTEPATLNGCDGEAFDVDDNQDGTVIQDNYSHNNAGGFLLMCTASISVAHHADVRYNLSVDDNATFSPAPCDGVLDPKKDDLSGIRVYNNTIVAAKPRVTVELDEGLVGLITQFFGDFVFQNNIVSATSLDASHHVFACGDACSNNVFFGRPVPTTATASVTADPRFVAPSLRGSSPLVAFAFLLRPGSPALGAGAEIPPGVPFSATRDFFGFRISSPPAIGFSER
jgi:hypothetical protein